MARQTTDRDCVFDSQFIEDLTYWVRTNPKVAQRLLDIIEAVRRSPFEGIGKPEPLKHFGATVWSRRLTHEHRIVYRVEKDRLVFLMGRFHY